MYPLQLQPSHVMHLLSLLGTVPVIPTSGSLVPRTFTQAVFVQGGLNVYFRNDYHALKKLRAHGTYILRAQLSPDVRYLATASADRTVKLWSVPDLTPVSTLTDHTRWVWDCVFSADSSYLVTGPLVHCAHACSSHRHSFIGPHGKTVGSHVRGCHSNFHGAFEECGRSCPERQRCARRCQHGK